MLKQSKEYKVEVKYDRQGECNYNYDYGWETVIVLAENEDLALDLAEEKVRDNNHHPDIKVSHIKE